MDALYSGLDKWRFNGKPFEQGLNASLIHRYNRMQVKVLALKYQIV